MVCFAFQLSLKSDWVFLHCPQEQIHWDISLKPPQVNCSFLEVLSEVELKASVKELDFGSTSNIVELLGQAH